MSGSKKYGIRFGDNRVCTLQQQILSHWELTRNRVDDLKDRQYHVRNLEELFK